MEPPFGNDNLSAWERDSMLSTANEELIQETTVIPFSQCMCVGARACVQVTFNKISVPCFVSILQDNQRKMVTFQPIDQEEEEEVPMMKRA